MEDEQREVVAFLRDPELYPSGAAPVQVIETHASLVFLAGAYAYKLKRAVKYAYLDFSTLTLRLAACTAELKLNRRTAPSLYLEVRAISRTEEGRLRWGREGRADDAVVDYVVVMRRFEQRDLLDNLARRGALSPPLLYTLTKHIAEFHGKAEKRLDRGGSAIMAGLVETNIGILRRSRAAGFDPGQIDRIETALGRELSRCRRTARFEARRRQGAPLSRRFASGQYLRRGRKAAAVRLHRVFRGHRQHRRAVRSRLPVDGSGSSRASRFRQSRAEPLPGPDRRG